MTLQLLFHSCNSAQQPGLRFDNRFGTHDFMSTHGLKVNLCQTLIALLMM